MVSCRDAAASFVWFVVLLSCRHMEGLVSLKPANAMLGVRFQSCDNTKVIIYYFIDWWPFSLPSVYAFIFKLSMRQYLMKELSLDN